MFLSQIKKLRELQEQHAHALAAAKQQGHVFTDDSEKLATLALFELNLKIVTAIQEYAEITRDDEGALAGAAVLFAGASGAVSGYIGRSDPTLGESTLAVARDHQQLEYEKCKNE